MIEMFGAFEFVEVKFYFYMLILMRRILSKFHDAWFHTRLALFFKGLKVEFRSNFKLLVSFWACFLVI